VEKLKYDAIVLKKTEPKAETIMSGRIIAIMVESVIRVDILRFFEFTSLFDFVFSIISSCEALCIFYTILGFFTRQLSVGKYAHNTC
jgi:hypothetical protein